MSTLFGGTAAAASSTAQSQGDLSKDVAVKELPEDSVSSIRFSPKSDHLAVASWDKKVRIYEISATGDSQGKAIFEHEGPVLSCAWSSVGLPSAPDVGGSSAANASDRMGPKWLEAVQIKQHACSISTQTKRHR